MSIVNGVIEYPFTKIGSGHLGDVETALGRTCKSHVQLVRDIDGNGNRVNVINKWAKYKPVAYNGLTGSQLDSTTHKWKSNANWWKGADGQCGMTFTTYTALGTPSSGFLAQLLAGNLGWGYTPPSGASTQPLRAFDFIQYLHTAPKPVTGIPDTLRLYGGGKLHIQLDETRAQDNLGIQLSDLTIGGVSTSAWYAGILIWYSNSQYSFAFSTGTLNGGDLSVDFTNMTSYGGKSVKIVPFIASKRANQGTDPGAGVYLSCDVAPQTLTIAAEVVSVQLTINAQWMEALHARVHYDVNIINNTTSAVAVNNLVIALHDGSQNINTRNVGNISIPAQNHTEYSGNFMVQNYDSSKTYTIKVSSSRSEVNGSAPVEEPRG